MVVSDVRQGSPKEKGGLGVPRGRRPPSPSASFQRQTSDNTSENSIASELSPMHSSHNCPGHLKMIWGLVCAEISNGSHSFPSHLISFHHHHHHQTSSNTSRCAEPRS
jgi:hypothetical protein